MVLTAKFVTVLCILMCYSSLPPANNSSLRMIILMFQSDGGIYF